MPIVPRVLIPLDEDCVTARDEQAGRGVARQVVVERAGLRQGLVAQGRLGGRADEPRRRGGSTDQPPFPDLVVVTESADEERDARDDFDPLKG
jgi:hypothetical protein